MQFVAFDLADERRRQLRFRDAETRDPLMGADCVRDAGDLFLDPGLDGALILSFILRKGVQFRDDEGENLLAAVLVTSDDADLLDQRGLAIKRFDFVGINILAGGKDDDVLLPSRDGQVAVLVQEAQVAGVKPSVPDGLIRRGLILVIPLEDHGTGDEDLSDPVGIGGADAYLSSRSGLPHGAHFDAVKGIGRHRSGRFREPIPFLNREADIEEEAGDVGVETSAAADESSHGASELLLNRSEKPF